jgi:UDP-N-acetylglucosamine 2-epimerase (non-hydrolysing)
MTPFRVQLVAGSRADMIRLAPLWHALHAEAWCRTTLVLAGQHGDPALSDALMRELDLPAPAPMPGAAGGDARPDLMVMAGDGDAMPGCAQAAARLGIRTARLDAGLRSHDRGAPDEANRLAVDAACGLLWTQGPDADAHLVREGHPPAGIARVGNTAIDTLARLLPAARAQALPPGLHAGGYGVVTLHRPANVDDPAALAALCDALQAAARCIPLVFPLHPRTAARLAGRALAGVRLLPPLPYRTFIGLLCRARAAITDSSGVQEETSHLRIPCLTVRTHTERAATLMLGTNRLVTPADLPAQVPRALAGDWPAGQPIKLWDGQAGARVRDIVRGLAGA